jgi:glycine/D-amino acid oxidase-like deaminating enzyme
MGRKIIVVGSGIIGAATAYNLQKSGADVTIIDAGHANATQSSFGWVNASFFETPDHFRLRADAIAAYRDLSAELSLPINWCGCLCWEETGAAFDAQYQDLANLGYHVEEIDASRFSALEPHINQPPERCLMFDQEAAVDSGVLAQRLIQAATGLGARVITGVTVEDFITQGSKVTGVLTRVGTLFADHVVVAAGISTQTLMAGLDMHLPMLTRPALMLKTNPVAPIFTHVLVSELGELRQLPDGSLLMPAAINHQADTSEALASPPDDEADLALERLQALIPQIPLSWSHATVAFRPVPQDGLPVVGQVMDGLYVATMHSGITLGALMGKLITTEILDGPTDRLALYRPQRFTN